MLTHFSNVVNIIINVQLRLKSAFKAYSYKGIFISFVIWQYFINEYIHSKVCAVPANIKFLIS